jgi:hypothetical protein
MIRSSNFRRFWALTAIVVIVQLFVVMAMASSGALHKCLHDHADEPGHECAVTLMQSGGYDTQVPDRMSVAYQPAPPLEPLAMGIERVAAPCHLIGGVLAHAPPRGP